MKARVPNPSARLLVLDLVPTTPFRARNDESVPFVCGHARGRGVTVSCVAAFFPLLPPSSSVRDIALSEASLRGWDRLLADTPPTHVLVNERLSRDLEARLREGLRKSVAWRSGGFPPSVTVHEVERWLSLAPEAAVDPSSLLADVALPDYDCAPLDPDEEWPTVHTDLVGGPVCDYGRTLENIPEFRELGQAAASWRGCSFCIERVASGCEAPDGPAASPPAARFSTNLVELALRQLERCPADARNARHQGRFVLRCSTARRKLPELLEGMLARPLAPTTLLLDSRVDELLANREVIERFLPRLHAAKHALEFWNMGAENFSEAENRRFNKSVSLDDARAAYALLDGWQKEWPTTVGFDRNGGFGFILFTPWTTLEDLAVNATGIREFDGGNASYYVSSRLVLLDGTPITMLAEHDGLRADAFEDAFFTSFIRQGPFAELARGERPWRFRDPRVQAVASLVLRARALELSPVSEGDDELTREIAALPAKLSAPLVLLEAAIDELQGEDASDLDDALALVRRLTAQHGAPSLPATSDEQEEVLAPFPVSPSLQSSPEGCARRVLLIDAHLERARGGDKDRQLLLAPLALLRLHAAIRQREPDIDVRVLDWSTFGDEDRDAALRRLLDELQPAVVGISAFSLYVPLAQRIARTVRAAAPEVPIVLGGDHATTFPDGVGQYGEFDVYVVGDGSTAGPALLAALLDGKPLASLHSLAYRDANGVVRTPLAPAAPLLDDNPPPSWDLVDPNDYARGHTISTFSPVVSLHFPDGPVVPILSSQGCPFRCRFCERHARTNARRFSPRRVLADLRDLLVRFETRNALFYDNLPNLDRRWFTEVLTGMRDELDVRSGLMVRADLLDEAQIELMAEAGVCVVGCFPETGSDRIRGEMNKRLDLSLLLRNMELASSYGILVSASFIVGWPGETREEAEESLALAREPFFDFVNFSPLIYFGGADVGRQGLSAVGIQPDSPAYFAHLASPERLRLAAYDEETYASLVAEGIGIGLEKLTEGRAQAKAEKLGIELVKAAPDLPGDDGSAPGEGEGGPGERTISVDDSPLLAALAQGEREVRACRVLTENDAPVVEIDLGQADADLTLVLSARSERGFLVRTRCFNVVHQTDDLDAGRRRLLWDGLDALLAAEEISLASAAGDPVREALGIAHQEAAALPAETRWMIRRERERSHA